MAGHKNHKVPGVDYSALGTPVGRPRGQWILWKPGINSLSLCKTSTDFWASRLQKYRLLALPIFALALTLGGVSLIPQSVLHGPKWALLLLVAVLAVALLIYVGACSLKPNQRLNEYDIINNWIKEECWEFVPC